jgi:hypothetical protein
MLTPPASCQPFPTVLLFARLKSSKKMVSAEALAAHDSTIAAPSIEDLINTAIFSLLIKKRPFYPYSQHRGQLTFFGCSARLNLFFLN